MTRLRDPRTLSAIAALAVAAAVVLREVLSAWVPEHYEQIPCLAPVATPDPFGAVPFDTCFHGPWPKIAAHFAPVDPVYVVVAGVVAAVVTFLAIAALRWAWRSFR